MNAFTEKIRAGYQRAGLRIEDGLVIAISGGSDSIALMHATWELWQEKADRVVVAHVNHGLRGHESELDSRFVLSECREKGIPAVVRSVDVQRATQGGSESLEEAARRFRYEVLGKIAEEHNFGFVATAHHQLDQAETILHHTLRGTGVRGLQGMAPSRPLTPSTQLIRPMLRVEKQEVDQFLRERDLPFRSDSSNRDSAFTRNRIRNELLPLLTENFNSQAVSHLAQLGEHASEAIDILDHYADELLNASLLDRQPDSCRLDTSKLHGTADAMIRHAMILLWTQQDWPRQKMTFAHWSDVANSILEGGPVAKDLPHGMRFERKANMLHIHRRIGS